MTKIVKGIGKGIKKLAEGAKKVFKKLVKSKIFWAVVAVAAIAIAAPAIAGAMGGTTAAGGATAATTAATTGTTAATAGTAAATGATTAAAAAPTVGGAAAELAAIGGVSGSVSTPTLAFGADAALKGAAASQLAAAGGVQATSGSILNTLIAGATKGFQVMQANPIPTAIISNGLSSALTPSAAEERERMDRRDRERWNRNMDDVVNVDLGVAPIENRIAPKTRESGRVTAGSLINENIAARTQ